MICPERKSIEPIALNVGNGNVSAMQKFINSGPWDHEEIQADLQHVFAKELVPTAAGSPIGVVGVVDESAFTKKGDKSAGVARQHNGRLGKEDNCQVGVFLTAVTPGGTALLAHQLYLPEQWCEQTEESKDRRNTAHVPPGIEFRTKPRHRSNRWFVNERVEPGRLGYDSSGEGPVCLVHRLGVGGKASAVPQTCARNLGLPSRTPRACRDDFRPILVGSGRCRKEHRHEAAGTGVP